MNKRIMTVDELYLFCLKNNFTKFNSNETNTELVVEMPGLFEKSSSTTERHTEGMTPFVSRAFHDKVNLNKSKIETEVFENNLPSSHLRPILAHITRDEETNELDFGSHDFHIETIIEKDEAGNEVTVEKTVYDEQPIGVIDGSKNSIEYDEKADVNRAVLHGYLYNDYCQDAIDILNRRGTVDCSVELSIRAMSFDAKEKVLVLDDFYVSALTLLSAKTNPGMAGSNFKIEDFAVKNNSIQFDQNNKLIEILDKLNKTLSNFHINDSKESQEIYGKEDIENVGEKDIILNEEVEETVEVTPTEEIEISEEVEEIVENNSEESTEENETEAEDSETPAEDETPEVIEENKKTEDSETVVVNECVKPNKYSITMSNGDVKEFTLTLDDITNALYMLVNDTYGESDNTYYSVYVYEDNTIVMRDWWNNKAFKQSYKREEDNFSLVGDRIEVFSIWVTKEEETALDEMRANYSILQQFKVDTENAQIHAQKEEILNNKNYSVLAEKDENEEYKNKAYAKLVSEMDNYSLVDLEKELKGIFADHITNGGQFAFSGEPETKHVVNKKSFAVPTINKKPSRYGNLFNK